MNIMNSPEVSVVEPQSVPSRISVVLAEEVKVGGTQRVQRPRVDQDLRLLAGEAKPEDVARRERVNDYNFDLLEDMEPMVIVPGGNPSGSDRCDEYVNYLNDGNDARVPDDDSIVDSERKAWREYCASIFRKRFGLLSD